MKKTITISAAFLMLIATLGSCTKGAKGDTGATGATGAAGTNGTNGTNGTPGTNGVNGTNGTNGNANVTSGTITVPINGWDSSSSGHYYYPITDAAITADLVTNGCVAVFIQANTNVWQALPATIFWTNTQSYTFTYTFYSGGVTVFIDFSDNSYFASTPSETYKVVAIGGTLRKAHPNTDWKNYNEVMALISQTGALSNN